MGLLDNIKKVIKRETTVTSQQSSDKDQKPVQNIQVTSGIDPKVIDAMNERMTKIENGLGKLTGELEGEKKSLAEIENELESLKENVKMVVSLYELVSKDFNPFMDKTPEEIKSVTDTLIHEIAQLRSLVNSAVKDLSELYGVPDIDELVSSEGKI